MMLRISYVPGVYDIEYLVPGIAFFAFTSASLLSLVADSVILLFRLGATPPPAVLASLKYAYSPCVLSFFFLALLMLIYLHFIFSSFPFSISIWTSLVSSCLFLVGNMLSPRFRFLLRDSFTILRVSYICILIRTYADLTFFIFVWGIRFVPVIVCIIFCFYSISS